MGGRAEQYGKGAYKAIPSLEGVDQAWPSLESDPTIDSGSKRARPPCHNPHLPLPVTRPHIVSPPRGRQLQSQPCASDRGQNKESPNPDTLGLLPWYIHLTGPEYPSYREISHAWTSMRQGYMDGGRASPCCRTFCTGAKGGAETVAPAFLPAKGLISSVPPHARCVLGSWITSSN